MPYAEQIRTEQNSAEQIRSRQIKTASQNSSIHYISYHYKSKHLFKEVIKIGQAEIQTIIESDPKKWWTSNELCELTGTGRNTVLRAAGQLAKHNMIDQRWIYEWNGICNKPMYGFRARK